MQFSRLRESPAPAIQTSTSALQGTTRTVSSGYHQDTHETPFSFKGKAPQKTPSGQHQDRTSRP